MKTAILVIHGIGDQVPGFADDFAKLVLDKTGNTEVKVFPCFWKDLISTVEDAKDKEIGDLSWQFLRKLMIEFVGDATAYQLSGNKLDFYSNVHTRLDSVLSDASDWLNGEGKLIWVAHSLGTIISDNFIWDSQNKDSEGNEHHQASAKALDAISKLDTLYTLGSPLLIWSLQRNGGGNPIKVNKWINIYSPCDIIGYPLKDINDAYKNSAYIEDMVLSVGGLVDRFTPMSHLGYLTDHHFIQMIVDEVTK